jgi:mitochondrial fission 1 protein
MSTTAEIYRAEPARRRECLYYLALGHYKMGNFEEARKFNGTSNL